MEQGPFQADEIEQYRFLVRLDDALRPLLDPDQITRTAAALLGRHLGVNRCAYAWVDDEHDQFTVTGDYNDGVHSIVGVYPSSSFGAEFVRLSRMGVPYVVDDAETDARVRDVLDAYRATAIRAVVSVPVIKGGRFAAGMALHQSSPRHWQAHEITLLSMVAHRCWESIERNRVLAALRESERRAVEAARQAEASTRRLNAVLDTAPVGIVYAGADGRLLLANRANRAIWGEHPLSENAAEYREWKGWWPRHGERAEQPVGAGEWPLARALHGEDASCTVEIEPFGSPGTRRTLMISARPVRGADGAIEGAVVANMDISEQVKAEIALRESEAKFRMIANAMPQIVWSTRADGFHDYFNDKWYELTGTQPGRGHGDDWLAQLHPDDIAPLSTSWRHSLATGAPYEAQFRLRHRDGQYRWMLGRALPLFGDDGAILRWMGTSTDIHEQKDAEAELQASNQRKDEFLAMLAHELRNPLAPISTAAQLLKIGGADEKRVRHASDIIARQVQHMTELVDDLLDVSRVTRGLVTLEKERVDIQGVVANAVEQVRPLVESRGHELSLRVAAADVAVLGDRNRLVQVLANLLNNAAKYTPQGGRIELDAAVQGERVLLTVSDNGIGIDGDLLPHVFELFTQAQRTPDRSQGGLGLGLALVRSIVTMHGGRVEARSQGRGRGSSFSISLPLASGQDSQAATPDSAAPASARRSLKLMVVDDNVDAAVMLAMLLEAEGHQVITASDGAQALAAAPSFGAQVYILDIGLPDLDGYELARRLRAAPGARGAVFIALTGYGQAHDRVLSKTAGFDHHFVKPVEIGELQRVLAGVA